MLNLQNVSKAFKDVYVLNDVSFSLNAGEIIALVGKNGAGKTTLLKVMLGLLEPDLGCVLAAHEYIGYVPQDTVLGTTIAQTFDANIKTWQRDYALSLVGLEDKSPTTLVKNLSGGQKTRLAFAKVLAANPEPTILLLDEPTNNLDIDGLMWLKQFVLSFKGGIVLVSHDRAFINAVATKVIELYNGNIAQYGGNYDFYKQQKEIERQAKLDHYKTSAEEQKRITKGMQAIQDRAQKGLRQKSPKDNDKAQFNWHQNNVQRTFSKQLKAVKSRLDQLETVERPEDIKSFAVKFGGETSASKLILQLEGVGKRYFVDVLRDVDLKMYGNERIYVAGGNGSGKTTLLKIAAGLIKPSCGTRTLGANVSIGYFSQEVDGLDHSKTVIDNLQLAKTKQTDVYRAAISLGFVVQDLKKNVSELSRGQQAKLGFAKLLFGAHQLLVIDEPTNHLDIATREQIELAMQNYKGAVLFASHDKYFVKTLRATKTLNLKNQ